MPLYVHFPEWLSPEIIPGLPFRWYGMMYLVAFAVGYYLVQRQVKERNLQVDNEEVANLFFWGIIALLVGARVFAALIYDTSGRFRAAPWLIFWPFDENMNFTGLQGMSYHGGMLGGVVGAVIYCRVRKLNVLNWGDMIVAAVPAGFTFGRIGNFINGELYGRVTTAPWGMVFPQARRLSTAEPWVANYAEQLGIAFEPGAMVNLPRHPSQLYQAGLEGVLLWLLLWFVIRKRSPFRGFMISMYMIGYGTFRFIAEYFREPDAGLGFVMRLSSRANPPQLFVSPLNFTMGQVLSALMILGGAIALAAFAYVKDHEPKVETFSADGEPKSSGSSESNRRRALRKKAGRKN